MLPSGRQCASGLSFAPSAARLFRSSRAHGWYGNPPCTSVPRSKNAAMLGAGGRLFSADLVPGAPPVPLTLPPAAAPSLQPGFSQTPDRSGWPSRNFGAGALTSTLPSAVLGTPGSRYRGHCADRDAAKTLQRTTTPATANRAFIRQIVPPVGAQLEGQEGQ